MSVASTLERLVPSGVGGREGPLSIGQLVAVTSRCDVPIDIQRFTFVFTHSMRQSGVDSIDGLTCGRIIRLD